VLKKRIEENNQWRRYTVGPSAKLRLARTTRSHDPMRAPSGGRGRAGGRLGGRYSNRGGGRGRGSFGDTTPDTVEGPTLEFTHSFLFTIRARNRRDDP